jgi:hypothetical protein
MGISAWNTTRIAMVLGSLLFLIYINDAEHEPLSDGGVINQFADDTLFYRSSLDYDKLKIYVLGVMYL